MPDAPVTFVPDVPDTFIPDEPQEKSPVNIAQYVAGGGPMAGLSLITPPGPAAKNPLASYIEIPKLKGESIVGRLGAAAANTASGLAEGIVSPLGVVTAGLGPLPKLAQGAIGAGFGVPAIKTGLERVYHGTALKDPQEAMEGALQAISGGLITAGAAHGLMAREAPRTFIPDIEKPPIIPPPKIADVQPPQTAPVNLELPPDKAPPTAVTGEAPQQAPSAGLAKEEGVAAPPAEPAKVEPTVTEPVALGVPPVIEGLGGARPEEVQPTGTGLKNAVGELERIGLGLEQAPESTQRNMAEAWSTAGEVETKAPGSGRALSDSLVANPERNLTDADSALLLRHKVDLFNRLNDAAEKTHSPDEAVSKAAQTQYDDLLNQYHDLLDAVQKRGSEWGREGRWRQAMAKEDFSFTSTDEINRYRRAVTGEDLPATKVEKAGKIAKDIKDAQGESDKATNAAVEEVRKKTAPPPSLDLVKAEQRALDAAHQVVREAAVRRAAAETKKRVAQAATEKQLAEQERATAQRAFDAATKQARDAAIRLAKEQSRVKERAKLDDQAKAAQAALDAANKVVRENAVRLADLESKTRVAKTVAERATAKIQEKAAKKAVSAADKLHRDAAIALAKAQRALRDDPVKAVWSKAKELLDKGHNNLDDIRTKIANELGMKVDQVTRIMAQDARTKRLMDDAWLKQQKLAVLRQNAKAWVRNLDTPGYERFLTSIPRILFGLKVGFHGTVALGTHAPTVAFQPRFWNTYIRDFGKMYKMVGSQAYYERQVQDLVRRPNYIKARRTGLVNDPRVYEDFNSPDTAKYFGRLTGMGNRGYTVLKVLRQDMFDQMYGNLPRSLQVQDSVTAALADEINHATGVVQGRAPKGTNLALFAPRLEAARVMQLAGDPFRAGGTFLNWANASAGDRIFAQNQLKEKAWIAGTFFSLLALNQGFLSAIGSKQKINGVPKVAGGAGFDPLESDFLKFKVAGMDVAYGSAAVNMARLPVRMATALMFHGKTSKLVLEDERMGKIALDYVRSQLSPFTGAATDLLIGRDYAQRPLPRAGFGLLPGRTDVPKRLQMHGITKPYTWAEYSSQQFTPIPISEGIREVWGQGLGMSDKQIEHYLRAWATISVMAGTGARVTPDRNITTEQ